MQTQLGFVFVLESDVFSRNTSNQSLPDARHASRVKEEEYTISSTAADLSPQPLEPRLLQAGHHPWLIQKSLGQMRKLRMRSWRTVCQQLGHTGTVCSWADN
jgi:hypothetical protein